MSPTLANVLAAAQSLSSEERRELIDLLRERLDEPAAEAPPVLSEAWRQEVLRRSAEHDAGKSETVSWQEVQERWKARRTGNG